VSLWVFPELEARTLFLINETRAALQSEKCTRPSIRQVRGVFPCGNLPADETHLLAELGGMEENPALRTFAVSIPP
jgi:hypothetical protein